MIALWDHEEIGSVSAFGAESNFIESCIERISVGLKEEGVTEVEAYQRSLASSYLISCDMAHSIHPSFPELHEDNLRPIMNSGPAVRHSSSSLRSLLILSILLLIVLVLIAATTDQDQLEAAIRFHFANDVPPSTCC